MQKGTEASTSDKMIGEVGNWHDDADQLINVIATICIHSFCVTYK